MSMNHTEGNIKILSNDFEEGKCSGSFSSSATLTIFRNSYGTIACVPNAYAA